MTRRVARLTPDRLAELGESTPCGACVFWELDAVARSRVGSAAARAEEKQAWLSHVLREWGSCGRVVLVDDAPVAWIGYAPAAFVPGADGFATSPVSADAVVLTGVHVALDHRGEGLGRLLVQSMARDLVQRGGVRAVEAFGRRGQVAAHALGAGCTVPAGFLGAVGFRTQRAHPFTPRMRMDLRSALTWRDEVEAALERLLGVVRPLTPAPEARNDADPSRMLETGQRGFRA